MLSSLLSDWKTLRLANDSIFKPKMEMLSDIMNELIRIERWELYIQAIKWCEFVLQKEASKKQMGPLFFKSFQKLLDTNSINAIELLGPCLQILHLLITSCSDNKLLLFKAKPQL